MKLLLIPLLAITLIGAGCQKPFLKIKKECVQKIVYHKTFFNPNYKQQKAEYDKKLEESFPCETYRKNSNRCRFDNNGQREEVGLSEIWSEPKPYYLSTFYENEEMKVDFYPENLIAEGFTTSTYADCN